VKAPLETAVAGHDYLLRLAASGRQWLSYLTLIELAIDGGGPDNITCIVADVVAAEAAATIPGTAGTANP
jgi:hypothetical protein